MCTNATGFSEAEKCDSDNVGNWTCPQGWDRCLTMHFTPKNGSMLLEIRNCTSTAGCDPSSQFYGKYNYTNSKDSAVPCSAVCIHSALQSGAMRCNALHCRTGQCSAV